MTEKRNKISLNKTKKMLKNYPRSHNMNRAKFKKVMKIYVPKNHHKKSKNHQQKHKTSIRNFKQNLENYLLSR